MTVTTMRRFARAAALAAGTLAAGSALAGERVLPGEVDPAMAATFEAVFGGFFSGGGHHEPVHPEALGAFAFSGEGAAPRAFGGTASKHARASGGAPCAVEVVESGGTLVLTAKGGPVAGHYRFEVETATGGGTSSTVQAGSFAGGADGAALATVSVNAGSAFKAHLTLDTPAGRTSCLATSDDL